jgi:hypothetical protein
MKQWADDVSALTDSPVRRVEALDAYESFADAMSIADLTSAMASAWSHEVRLTKVFISITCFVFD